jgi:ribosomal protein L5
MIDIEKIVVEICRRNRDEATGAELLKWTRIPRDQLLAALNEKRHSLFSLREADGDPLGIHVALVRGPEMDAIVTKYIEIMGHCTTGS